MAQGAADPVALPDDPALAKVVAAWRDAGFWVTAVDDRWRYVYLSDDLTSLLRGQVLVGEFYFGPVQVEAQMQGSAGMNTLDGLRFYFEQLGPWVLADIEGGRAAVREMVHPMLRELVDRVEPSEDNIRSYTLSTFSFGGNIAFAAVAQRVRDESGRVVGTVILTKPAVGMTTLFLLAAAGDLGHFEQMQRLAAAGRRPAAVLFADLESSSPLSKRLPTASYFQLVRRLTRAADACVIEAGGIVGRHAGDGVAAFFVAETLGSESAAARACISAARSLQASTLEIAARHDLQPDDVTVRAGLHWGATLYIGSIITRGRTEVTALGDEVNETARIEASAGGGRILASKDLIERLEPDDASALAIDQSGISYAQLADLGTATDKARRDAPAIAVCDLAVRTA